MSVEAVSLAVNSVFDVSAAEKFVLVLIAEHVRPHTTTSWPSIPRLARLACLSERHVQTIVKSLRKKGWLSVENRRRGGNRYHLALTRMAEAQRRNDDPDHVISGPLNDDPEHVIPSPAPARNDEAGSGNDDPQFREMTIPSSSRTGFEPRTGLRAREFKQSARPNGKPKTVSQEKDNTVIPRMPRRSNEQAILAAAHQLGLGDGPPGGNFDELFQTVGKKIAELHRGE